MFLFSFVSSLFFFFKLKKKYHWICEGLNLFVDFHPSLLLNFLLIKFHFIKAWKLGPFRQNSWFLYKFVLQLFDQICPIDSSICWNVCGPPTIILLDFLTNNWFIFSFWNKINRIIFGSLFFREIWVVNWGFLRTNFGFSHFLFFSIDFFLRPGFSFWVLDFGFFSEIVQVEKLFSCLGLPSEEFPKFLSFLNLFWVEFGLLHFEKSF